MGLLDFVLRSLRLWDPQLVCVRIRWGLFDDTEGAAGGAVGQLLANLKFFYIFDNFGKFWRLVKFETLITILTIENMNS